MGEKGKLVLNDEREFLKKKFQDKIGHTINTESDYRIVIEKCFKNDTSMMKTLKRFFNPNYKEAFSNTTLDKVARATDFKDWSDFKLKISDKWIPTKLTIEEVFESQREEIRRLQEEMICSKDGIYTLGWYPEKYIIITHEENYTYKVLESKRMYKKTGDTFDAPDFRLSPSTTEDSELPDIIIDDRIGYFEEHGGETEEYYKL